MGRTSPRSREGRAAFVLSGMGERAVTVSDGMSSPISRLRFSLALFAAALAGLMLGVAAGAPALVERVAIGAIGAVERRFDVRLDARRVDWSWSGAVEAHDVRVRTGDGELLATLGRVAIDADVDVLARRVAVRAVRLADVSVAVALRADGTTNLDGILRGLAPTEGGGGPALPGSRLLAGLAPEVEVSGLRIVVDLAPAALPAGLRLPPRVGLAGGRLTARPVGEWADRPPLREALYAVSLTFDDLSLDPGHGVSVDVEGGLERGLAAVHVDFSRPVRMPLGRRLLSLGGLGWSSDTASFEVREVRLSQPIPDGPAREVPAAIAVARVAVSPLPAEAIVALVRAGRVDGLQASVVEALGAEAAVVVESPVVALAIGEDGRHSLDDLLPPSPTSAASPREAAPGRGEAPPTARAPFGAAVGAGVGHGMALADRVLASARAALSRVATRLPALRVVGGRLFLNLRGAPLSIGDVAVSLDAGPAARSMDASGRLDGDASGTLSLSVRQDADPSAARPVTLRLSAEGLAAPSFRADLGLPGGRVRVGPSSRVSLLALELSGGREEGGPIDARVRLDASGFDLELPGLSETPIAGFDADLGAHLAWDPAAGLLRIDELVARRGRVKVSGEVDVLDPRGTPKLKLSLSLAPVPVQKVFDAIPPELVPTLRGLRIRGELSWALGVTLDTARIEDIVIDSRPLLTGFAVDDLGEVVDFGRLRGALPYGIRLADGSPGTRFVGPTTGSWVPLARIARWLPQALMTTEDGTFEHHDGISTLAIRESIIENLKRGAFVRGASTITQQLVKNLWLGGEKHLSRKLQELFIAWRLSAEFSKDEIMALYLNTIEFGPGLYGIGDAAYHWFGKRPEELSLGECIFLASIIPSPRRYHSFFEAGAITPRWENYLKMLLGVMHKRGRITEEELAAVDLSRLRFRSSPDFGHDDDGPVFDTPPDREEPGAFGTDEDGPPPPAPADDWDGDLLHRP